MNLDIGAILSRAWRLTWDNKVLWLFGILASLGSGGGPNFNFNLGGGGRGGQPNGDLPPEMRRFFDQFDPNLVVPIVLALVCVGLLLAVAIIALSVIGRGGLIGGLQRADAGGQVTFGEGWRLGLKHFWTLFLIGLVVGLVTFLAFVLTVVPGALFTAVTAGLGALCLFPLICLVALWPSSWASSVTSPRSQPSSNSSASWTPCAVPGRSFAPTSARSSCWA